MSYLLIGNISALICDDCIEPLANTRIRVYLPDTRYPADRQAVATGMFNDLRPLSAKEVLMKADRLLAEATLDSHGNFTLAWEEVHLFTEPLDLDLCLDRMPGDNASHQPRNYHLSKVVPHWKRNNKGYVGAYAYVIPSASWNTICGNAGAWVITGMVKHQYASSGQPRLKVEAYNALSGQMIGHAFTNESGRYTMHFSRKNLYNGGLQLLKTSRRNMGPDIYFKIYHNDQLIWEEDEQDATARERRDIAPCSCLDIDYKPSVVKKASGQLNEWLNEMISFRGNRRKKQDHLRMINPAKLMIKEFPCV
ncbi:hypothetical protein [Chitinophaga sp. MM2321]|uniref:hypothetical protein n=1 Tax=Chitinophaga sp. MM2321 TaxID=3137178 RepID=UPI0032D5AC10